MVQSVDRNGNIGVTNVFGLNILEVIARHCVFCFVFFYSGRRLLDQDVLFECKGFHG